MTGEPVYLAIATVVGIILSALIGFWWAGRSGQFHDVEEGSMAVFDADEVVGGKIAPEGTHDEGNL